MGAGIFFMILLFGFFLLLVWVGAIIDIVRSDFRDNNEKLIWVLLVILLPFIGTILYMVIGTKKRVGS